MPFKAKMAASLDTRALNSLRRMAGCLQPQPVDTDQFFLCSATTASDFHLLSAGHCAYNHDPLNDGSGRGAGFAAEMWAWPAQTDAVNPVYPSGWTDFPYGVSEMTFMTTYKSWINSLDFNWDFSFITLDRRIGDLTGWPGREWGVQGTSLALSRYPAEAPFGPTDNRFLYVGLDDNNVSPTARTGSTCPHSYTEA